MVQIEGLGVLVSLAALSRSRWKSESVWLLLGEPELTSTYSYNSRYHVSFVHGISSVTGVSVELRCQLKHSP